jgi:hypothetical protein
MRGNKIRRLVEWSRRDFEQVGCALLTHHTIHPGAVILSPRKKLKLDEAKFILVL